MILDTSFVIDVLQGKEEAVRKVEELEERDVPQKLTSVSIFELWSGIERSRRSEEEKRDVKEVLESRSILGLDRPAAEMAGRIDGKLMDKGTPVEPQDCMISGIALQEGEPILTTDRSHFEQIREISEIELEPYSE